VIHDQGTEFIGKNFQASNPLTMGYPKCADRSLEPPGQAACGRMHQVVGNILRIILHTYPPPNAIAANAVIDYLLQTAAYAMKATSHRTLEGSPGVLVFHQDMIMDLPFIADLLVLRNK
jgi:hypothetical protein